MFYNKMPWFHFGVVVLNGFAGTIGFADGCLLPAKHGNKIRIFVLSGFSFMKQIRF